MKILITGAAGFIGSHLMDALYEEHQVTGVDNFLTGSSSNFEPVYRLDIVDRAELYAAANELQPELIIHCAASYSDPDAWHRDTDTNIAGAINVTNVARHHGARVIYFQTILPPVSSYAISKIAAEQYLRISGIPLTVFKLANVYGPRNLSGPVPVFYKRITEGKPCLVVDTQRDFIFIEDVLKAVLANVEEPKSGTFDLCTGEKTSIMEMYLAIAKELGHKEVPPLVPPAPDDVQGEISVNKRPFGWTATWPLEHGIKKTIASYDRHGVDDAFTHLRIKG